MRNFFFVLLGVLVDFSGLHQEFLASLGIVAVLFVARSELRCRSTESPVRERRSLTSVATLLIPRGLITAVLALDAVRAMKPQLDFLTPLAFAIILLTNVLVLLAAIRAKDDFRKSRRRRSRTIVRKPPDKPAWRVGFHAPLSVGINPLPPCGNRPPEMIKV